MLSSFIGSSPRISQASIQARNGFASTPAWPTPPRAKVWAKRWVSARVTAAWPIQICWLAQPSCWRARRDRLAKQRPLRAIGRAIARRRDWPSRTTTRCETPDAGRGRREMQMSCRVRPAQIRRALSPSPAKPCASALPPSPARSAPPIKPRRVIRPLPLIGKDPDQAGRLHARQPDDREARTRQAPPPSRRRRATAVAAGRHETAAASRTP